LNGYPCIITLADKEVSCEDRQALEETLKLMLASPDVGEKILRLIESSAVLA
jgi:tripartite-type tricarboxylate transporter receptor subunit TctC